MRKSHRSIERTGPAIRRESMNLNTITEVKLPSAAEDITNGRPGLPGLPEVPGCFRNPRSRPHAHRSRVAPLALTPTFGGRPGDRRHVQGRGTRSVRRAGDADWTAAPLFRQCCRSFLASFKIWNEATVGGNICMSLPAGPMISLTAALEGVCTLWPRSGEPRQVSRRRFRDRQPPECPRTRRIAAIDLPARSRAPQEVRLPTVHAHAPRAIGSAADRHRAAPSTANSCSRSPPPPSARFSSALKRDPAPRGAETRDRRRRAVQSVPRRRARVAGPPQALDVLLRGTDSLGTR